jgi:tRNA uracil 4-sulfurtransferase
LKIDPEITPPVIIAHYHELWLKGRNRRFFLTKLAIALRRSFDGIPVQRVEQPGDRFMVRLGEGASLEAAHERMGRVFGVINYGVGRQVEPKMDEITSAAWDELSPLAFRTFAVRAQRSDKSFPHNSMEIERAVGGVLLDRLRAAGRDVRVDLTKPEITCYIEITPGPALVYAGKYPGPGGLPANTAGRMLCLLSGGYDSAVAAYQMMKRGAHLNFVHFYAGGSAPGESSVHVVRELARVLIAYQFTGRLYLVPFEPVQREIVRFAPETYRILLYRRMMLRIAEFVAHRERCLALLTGDSLSQVASQTLQNMVAVGAAIRLPVFRPLAGTDKLDIQALARKIGTYDISSGPFHDCCPIFQPRMPALYANAPALAKAETNLDVDTMVRQALRSASVERFRFAAGKVEQDLKLARSPLAPEAIAPATVGPSTLL